MIIEIRCPSLGGKKISDAQFSKMMEAYVDKLPGRQLIYNVRLDGKPTGESDLCAKMDTTNWSEYTGSYVADISILPLWAGRRLESMLGEGYEMVIEPELKIVDGSMEIQRFLIGPKR